MRHWGVRGYVALAIATAACTALLVLTVGSNSMAGQPRQGEAVPVETPAPTAESAPVSRPTATRAPTSTPEPSAPEPAPPVIDPPDPLRPNCAGARAMSVWAHPDDDLLFLGPQLPSILASGGCVRTVFLTDGDAGRGADYAAGRVRGIQRAYDVLRGASSQWSAQQLSLPSGSIATVHQPVDDPRVSLVFLHLPDGNLNGQGYPTTGEVSLAKLAADRIAALPQSNSGGSLSWHGVVGALNDLITGYNPGALYTHVPGSALTLAKGDHADHAITGILARQAWRAADRGDSTITYAMGYQSAQHPSNLDGDVLARKVDAFRVYAADDPVIRGCADHASCLAVLPFGGWLSRQYLYTDADLG